MKRSLFFISLLIMALAFDKVAFADEKSSESTCQVIVEENKANVKSNDAAIIHINANKNDKVQEEVKKEKVKKEKVKKEEVKKEKVKKEKVKKEKVKKEEVKKEEVKKEEVKKEEVKKEEVKADTPKEKVSAEKISGKEAKKKDKKQKKTEKDNSVKEAKTKEINLSDVKKENERDDEVKADVKTSEITKSQEVKPAKSDFENNFITSEVMTFIEKWGTLQNAHKISAIKRLYADEYVNTDGYNKEQLFKLMESTFENYPDIRTEYKVDAITVNSNYAAAYVSQNVTAASKLPSKITGDKGQYNASLRTIIYIKKINREWKIYSEQTTYEVSSLAYGTAKDLKAELKVPQKVLSGSDYCAGISVDIPADYTAIASINSTQLVEGFKLNGENFRQVSLSDATLERVLKANSDNNNEAVFVSIGYTQKNHDVFKKPKIELSGLLMLMQRVDVIPATSNLNVQKGQDAAKK